MKNKNLHNKPNLDYPYLSLPDIDEEEIEYKQENKQLMTYYEKYHCNGCPVEKYCGTMVSCSRLCHSYNDDIAVKESASVLTMSKSD